MLMEMPPQDDDDDDVQGDGVEWVVLMMKCGR